MKEKIGFHYTKIQSKKPHHNFGGSEGKESTELTCKYVSQIKKKSPISTWTKEEHQKLMRGNAKEKHSITPIINRCKLQQRICFLINLEKTFEEAQHLEKIRSHNTKADANQYILKKENRSYIPKVFKYLLLIDLSSISRNLS